MTYPIPTNPPWAMGASLHTVTGIGSSLETVFGMGNPPISSFTPGQLSGLVGWWDASQVLGVPSGTSLSTWTDLSGNGHNLSTSLVTQLPVLLTNNQNGLSVVSFVGNAGGALISMMTTAFTLVQPTTLALTFSLSKTAAQQDITDGITGASMIFGPVTAAQMQIFAGVTLGGNSLSTSSWYVASAIFNGSASTVSSLGSAFAGNAGTATPSGLAVGTRNDKTNGAQVKLGEIVLYSQAQSAINMAKLESYLKNKWGAV